MKLNINQLAALFDELETKYKVLDNNRLVLTVPAENYIEHTDGETSLLIVAHLDLQRGIVNLYAPNCIDLTSSDHREKASQLLLWMNYRSELPRFEIDLADNEVRCTASTSFGDAFIDSVQLRSMLSSRTRAVDEYWDVIVGVLKTGKLPETLYEKRERYELADLIRVAGGVEGLRKILNECGLIH